MCDDTKNAMMLDMLKEIGQVSDVLTSRRKTDCETTEIEPVNLPLAVSLEGTLTCLSSFVAAPELRQLFS